MENSRNQKPKMGFYTILKVEAGYFVTGAVLGKGMLNVPAALRRRRAESAFDHSGNDRETGRDRARRCRYPPGTGGGRRKQGLSGPGTAQSYFLSLQSMTEDQCSFCLNRPAAGHSDADYSADEVGVVGGGVVRQGKAANPSVNCGLRQSSPRKHCMERRFCSIFWRLELKSSPTDERFHVLTQKKYVCRSATIRHSFASARNGLKTEEAADLRKSDLKERLADFA